MLLLLLLYYFHLFINFIHNVPLQKEMANLWHTNESKVNVGIQSFTRYAILNNWDEFQYVIIPCTNILYMLHNVLFKHLKMNLNRMFINQTTSSLP
jgi:hypothetical protein